MHSSFLVIKILLSKGWRGEILHKIWWTQRTEARIKALWWHWEIISISVVSKISLIQYDFKNKQQHKVISLLFSSSWDKETIRLVQTLTQRETGNMFICLFW